MRGRRVDSREVVVAVLSSASKEIQQDLGEIRLEDVVHVLFKFGVTVLDVYQHLLDMKAEDNHDHDVAYI